jgi:rhodanese-related sulfurtransferase
MSYAGDVTPIEAFRSLETDPSAVLVDVRTRPELAYVGYPDLSTIGKQLIAVEWQQFPTGALNPRFLDELADQGVDPERTVYFICRSGARSQHAAIAATAGGFTRAHNVAFGFEGPPDAEGHRGSAAGWKASGLPWRQS